MATWIFILHMLVPLSGGLQAIEAVSIPSQPAAAEPAESESPRYRGLEKMFAKFDAEA